MTIVIDETAPGAKPTPFSLHLAAYNAATATYETHCAAHKPADDADGEIWSAYENSYGALVMAMHDAGKAAVIEAPAANANEIAAKMEIISAQELHLMTDGDEILAVIKAIADDATRFAGAAA